MLNIATKTKASSSSGKLAADTNKTGSWSEVSITETTASDVSIDGENPIHESVATFMYSGGTAGSPPVPVPPNTSIVTLSPGTTAITVQGRSLLREDDKAEDIHGNKVKVCQSSPKAGSD